MPTASIMLLRRQPDWALLLVRRADRYRWKLPGGHVQPTGTASDTALDEAHAATGRPVVLLPPPHQPQFPDGFGVDGEIEVPSPWWIVRVAPLERCLGRHLHVDHLYVGLIDTATPPSTTPRQHRWVTAEMLPDVGMADSTRRLAHDLLQRAAAGRLPTPIQRADEIDAILRSLAGVPGDAPPGPSYAEICQRFDQDPDWQRRIADFAAALDAEDAQYARAVELYEAGNLRAAEPLLRSAAEAGFLGAEDLLASIEYSDA
jgi:8-oxo-dGTP pyrophosphatase MutT (NUDIX family)